jgi:hypothetical protein
MLPFQYGVLTFDKFFMHFAEESEESLSTGDCYSDLTFVEGKFFRETTKKSADTVARISKATTALQCLDVF